MSITTKCLLYHFILRRDTFYTILWSPWTLKTDLPETSETEKTFPAQAYHSCSYHVPTTFQPCGIPLDEMLSPS